jgi:hypothetical protein
MANNVIEFPKSFSGIPIDAAAIREELNDRKIEVIDELVDEALSEGFGVMHEFGFKASNQYDIGLIVEAMRSMLMREKGIFNPLQDMADQMVVVVNDKGERVHANGFIATTENNS